VLSFMAGCSIHLSGHVREHSLCEEEPNKDAEL